MNLFLDSFNISQDYINKAILSAMVVLVLTAMRFLTNLIIKKRAAQPKQVYSLRRTTLYIYTILLFLFVGRIWLEGIDSLTTFLGLASAGVAIALHDLIANIAGWVFILWRTPFKVGDRIEIGDTAGDVVDIRFFQFSIVEIRNWIDADQSTGRIVHIPNNLVLKEPLANYQIGFEYIWNELPILITFESDWKLAKKLLTGIANTEAIKYAEGARQQIDNAVEKYLIVYGKLTPIVYTSVRDSGVLLTLRYLVNPRIRRGTEQHLWEAILDSFGEAENIDLAYPTTRFYK